MLTDRWRGGKESFLLKKTKGKESHKFMIIMEIVWIISANYIIL